MEAPREAPADDESTAEAGPTDDDIIESMITGTSRRQRKVPNIDRLPDVIVAGELSLKIGDHIVIERWFGSGEKRHWMGTNTYSIVAIHDNGDLSLTDVVNRQAAMANWKTGPARGWRFKDGRPKKTRRA